MASMEKKSISNNRQQEEGQYIKQQTVMEKDRISNTDNKGEGPYIKQQTTDKGRTLDNM